MQEIQNKLNEILLEEIVYFKKHGVKSPNLARIQNMMDLDNEDFAEYIRLLRLK